MCGNQNLFFPKILKQKALQTCAVVERGRVIGWLVPIHRKVAIDDIDAVFGQFAPV
jgi:hypothetical protein